MFIGVGDKERHSGRKTCVKGNSERAVGVQVWTWVVVSACVAFRVRDDGDVRAGCWEKGFVLIGA